MFTTIAVRSGHPVLWDKHWKRLANNCEALGIDNSGVSESDTRRGVSESLELAGLRNGRVRITISDETASSIWNTRGMPESSVEIVTGDLRKVPNAITVRLSSFPVNSRSPLAGVKSCNYLENLLAIEEAIRTGFHEAVRINERGKITSGCMSNVFWLKSDTLYTPSLRTGCLPGTTREFVLENLECREVEAGIDELDHADAIFLSSAGIGIVAVAGFESKKFSGIYHPILSLWPPKL